MTPDPAQVARLRAALARDPGLDSFEGLPWRRAPIAFGCGAEAVLAEDAAPFLRPGPARLFGAPEDPACLDGIGSGLRWLPRRVLRRVPGAMVVGHDAVLARDNTLLCPDPVPDAAAARALAAGHDHHGLVLREDAEGFFVHHAGAPAGIGIGEEPGTARPLFLHDPEPGNHGSFLFRVLPQLAFVAESGWRDFDCYVASARPALREALALLGLPALPIHTVAEVAGLRFDALHMANGDAEGLLTAPALDLLRAAANRLERMPPARLYVSRRLATRARPWHRPLANEAEIESLARRRGLEPVLPETRSLAWQAARFATATALAGPSGSGMLNALFMPHGAKVLDLESVQVTVRQHANLYASSGKRHAFLFGRTEDGDGPFAARPWRVDPALMEAGLDWLDAGG